MDNGVSLQLRTSFWSKDLVKKTSTPCPFGMIMGLEFPRHDFIFTFLSCPKSLTCRCRLSAHTPGQVSPLSWAGEQEEAAAVSSAGSYRSMSEMCTTSAEGPGTSSATGCWLPSEGAHLFSVKDTNGNGQLGLLLLLFGKRYGGSEMCKTFEVPVSMFCHLLTGSATTSQSGQADWRSLAKVDFPTADVWKDIVQETTSWHKYFHLILKYCTYQCFPL